MKNRRQIATFASLAPAALIHRSGNRNERFLTLMWMLSQLLSRGFREQTKEDRGAGTLPQHSRRHVACGSVVTLTHCLLVPELNWN